MTDFGEHSLDRQTTHFRQSCYVPGENSGFLVAAPNQCSKWMPSFVRAA